MIIDKTLAPDPLAPDSIYEVLATQGPCITLVLPPYHPGEQSTSTAVVLKAMLHEVVTRLAEFGLCTAEISEILDPLRQLANDPASLSGSHRGCALLRSPDVFRRVQLRHARKASIAVGDNFAVRRLLSELTIPQAFYILSLSKEAVQLYRCSAEHVEPVEFPKSVPSTLDAALALDYPDHDLENRSMIGTSTGSMHAMRFGSGKEGENQASHLADFYSLIDRGIRKYVLHGSEAPLVLAGVDECIGVYCATNSYPHLATRHLHSDERFASNAEETLADALALLAADAQEHHRTILNDAMERLVPSLILTDPRAIVSAAVEGRVRELFLCREFESQSPATQALLNDAVVQTLLHKGTSFELPAALMPQGSAAVAILRY
jgi:Bacterial archaeo-eukaryotic release factor family 7